MFIHPEVMVMVSASVMPLSTWADALIWIIHPDPGTLKYHCTPPTDPVTIAIR
jgi:hypothetical protein